MAQDTAPQPNRNPLKFLVEQLRVPYRDWNWALRLGVSLLLLWAALNMLLDPTRRREINQPLTDGQTLQISYPAYVPADGAPSEVQLRLLGKPAMPVTTTLTVRLPDGLVVVSPALYRMDHRAVFKIPPNASLSARQKTVQVARIGYRYYLVEYIFPFIFGNLAIDAQQTGQSSVASVYVFVWEETALGRLLRTQLGGRLESGAPLILLLTGLISAILYVAKQSGEKEKEIRREWELIRERTESDPSAALEDYLDWQQKYEGWALPADLNDPPAEFTQGNRPALVQAGVRQLLEQDEFLRAERIIRFYLPTIAEQNGSASEWRWLGWLATHPEVAAQPSDKQYTGILDEYSDALQVADWPLRPALASSLARLVIIHAEQATALKARGGFNGLTAESRFRRLVAARLDDRLHPLGSTQHKNDLLDLLDRGYQNPTWPEIWRPAPADRDLEDWLKNTMQVQAHPFPSAPSERDIRLMDPPYEHPQQLGFQHFHTEILYGPPGAGRTAAARLLIDMLQNHHVKNHPDRGFPVSMCLRAGEGGSAETWLAQSAADEIGRFLAYNPHQYLEYPEISQKSTARLLGALAGSPEELVNLWGEWQREAVNQHREKPRKDVSLAQLEARGDQVLEAALSCLRTASGDAKLTIKYLLPAIPADYRRMYLIIDVQAEADVRMVVGLMRLAERLNRSRACMKLLLPENLYTQASGQALLSGAELQWTEDQLCELVETRLGQDSFFDYDIDNGPRELAKQAHTPGELIRMGQQLIRFAYREKLSKINRATLTKFFNEIGATGKGSTQ